MSGPYHLCLNYHIFGVTTKTEKLLMSLESSRPSKAGCVLEWSRSSIELFPSPSRHAIRGWRARRSHCATAKA